MNGSTASSDLTNNGGGSVLLQFQTGAGLALNLPAPCTPPTFTSTPPATARVGQPLEYVPTTSGDGPIEITAHSTIADLTWKDGKATWTPSSAGKADLSFHAESDHGAADQRFTVEITDGAPSSPGDAATSPADPNAKDADAGGCAQSGRRPETGAVLGAALVAMALLAQRRRHKN